jgi:hypothetical protein
MKREVREAPSADRAIIPTLISEIARTFYLFLFWVRSDLGLYREASETGVLLPFGHFRENLKVSDRYLSRKRRVYGSLASLSRMCPGGHEAM